MSAKTIQVTPQLDEYLTEYGMREPQLLRRLREETAELEQAAMQISALQGQFMRVLVRAIGAQRALEVGTFTGYSALCVAMALPADGELIACDVSEEWTSIGKRYWAEAGVAQKIELRLGPAKATLDELIAAGRRDDFDVAFIDADKPGYDDYYERCLELVRPEGLILIDNVLWGGSVTDPEDDSENTEAIRALNRKIVADQRVELSMLPIGDGLTMARVRP